MHTKTLFKLIRVTLVSERGGVQIRHCIPLLEKGGAPVPMHPPPWLRAGGRVGDNGREVRI